MDWYGKVLVVMCYTVQGKEETDFYKMKLAKNIKLW